MAGGAAGMKAPRRILLVSLTNIGDAILTTPVLEALHRHWPSAAITLVVGPRAVSLFERDPRVAEVVAHEKDASWIDRVRLIWRLRPSRFDRVVNVRHGWLPRRPGHRVLQHLEVIRRWGIPTEGLGPSVHVTPEDTAAADRWLSQITPGAPLVAVAPGARSHLKRWTTAGFAAVCDALIRERGAQILFVGDAADQPIVHEVRAKMAYPSLDMTGRTTLRQLAALFARMSLVVTNDSACLHLAGASGAPVVAVFGPTDPVKYGPRGAGDAVVRLGLICSPCERALCPYGHECLQTLSPGAVLAAAKRALSAAS